MSNNIPVLNSQSPILQVTSDGQGGQKVLALASSDFYRFINAVRNALGVGSPQAAVATPSPMVYTSKASGYLAVAGGTVSKIEYSADGKSYFDTGMVSGLVPLQTATFARITYSVMPTLTFIPGAA